MNRFNLVATRDSRGVAAVGVSQTNQTSLDHPVLVDFLSPKLTHRLRNGADHEFLVKSVGLKKLERNRLIFDFTAGLGVDSFILASAGFRVVGFEREPFVFSLLQDGLKRYQSFILSQEKSAVKLIFENKNVALATDEERKTFCTNIVALYGERPDTVFLDPMFDDQNTKAKSLPKKEMALFRNFVTPSTEEELENLLLTALSVGTRRVLVKRPCRASALPGAIRPVDRREAKTAAFDIYACR